MRVCVVLGDMMGLFLTLGVDDAYVSPGSFWMHILSSSSYFST